MWKGLHTSAKTAFMFQKLQPLEPLSLLCYLTFTKFDTRRDGMQNCIHTHSTLKCNFAWIIGAHYNKGMKIVFIIHQRMSLSHWERKIAVVCKIYESDAFGDYSMGIFLLYLVKLMTRGSILELWSKNIYFKEPIKVLCKYILEKFAKKPNKVFWENLARPCRKT